MNQFKVTAKSLVVGETVEFGGSSSDNEQNNDCSNVMIITPSPPKRRGNEDDDGNSSFAMSSHRSLNDSWSMNSTVPGDSFIIELSFNNDRDDSISESDPYLDNIDDVKARLENRIIRNNQNQRPLQSNHARKVGQQKEQQRSVDSDLNFFDILRDRKNIRPPVATHLRLEKHQLETCSTFTQSTTAGSSSEEYAIGTAGIICSPKIKSLGVCSLSSDDTPTSQMTNTGSSNVDVEISVPSVVTNNKPKTKSLGAFNYPEPESSNKIFDKPSLSCTRQPLQNDNIQNVKNLGTFRFNEADGVEGGVAAAFTTICTSDINRDNHHHQEEAATSNDYSTSKPVPKHITWTICAQRIGLGAVEYIKQEGGDHEEEEAKIVSLSPARLSSNCAKIDHHYPRSLKFINQIVGRPNTPDISRIDRTASSSSFSESKNDQQQSSNNNALQRKADHERAYWRTHLSNTIMEYGYYHNRTAQALMQLGNASMNCKAYSQAASAFTAACKIWQKKTTYGMLPVARAMDSIGLAWTRYSKHDNNNVNKYYDKAMEALNVAFDIRYNILGPHHVDTVDTLNKIAAVYLHTCQYAMARDAYWEVYCIRKAIFGPDHPSVAISAQALGNVYTKLGKLKQANQYFTLALTTYDKMGLHDDHPTVARLLHDHQKVKRLLLTSLS